MELTRLPLSARLRDYQKQAEELLDAWRAGDPGARQIFTHSHPRCLNPDIPWLPRNLSDDELRSASLDMADAQLALARWYDFGSWTQLAE